MIAKTIQIPESHFVPDYDFLIAQFKNVTDERIHEVPTEYIERVRYLPKHLTPFPGYFEFDRTPYLRKIFNLLSPEDPTEEIVVMKSAQIGYTVGILENGVIFFIGCNPRTVQFITADNKLAEETVKTRIDPAIDFAGLRDKIFAQAKRKGSRSTGDTTLLKEFPGGFASFGGAKNVDNFRGKTYQITLEDEIDTYKDDSKEGNLLDLIKNRSNAFSNTRKIIYGSTPLIEQTSKIFGLYKLGDQQNYFVPCKHCGEMQVLRWHGKNEDGTHYGIFFDHENNMPIYDSVGYQCKFCGKIMKDHDKVFFLRDKPMGGLAEWRATAKPLKPRLKSFWINALYSPPGMYSWSRMVEDWAEAWDIDKNRVKDFEKYRSFRNTKQGLPFQDQGDQMKEEKIITHRRNYYIKGQVPNRKAVEETGSEILIITCSVDVQQENIFVHVVGWCDGGANYTIDFFSVEGDVRSTDSPVWTELYKIVTEKVYVADDGKKYMIANTLVDSGRYSEYIYAFTSRFTSGVIAIKGDSFPKTQIPHRLMSKEVCKNAGGHAYLLNVDMYKDRIAKSFNTAWNTGELQPEWYPNFPDDLGDDFFRMFTAESRTVEKNPKNGKIKRIFWKQTKEANHAFDTFGYNHANLGLIAEYACFNEITEIKADGVENYLERIDYQLFWEYAKKGVYYS